MSAKNYEADKNEVCAEKITSNMAKIKLQADKAEVLTNDNATSDASVTVGIDLGTTYCCVAFLQNGEVKVIPNTDGDNTTPSYVVLTEEGEIIVGKTAKEEVFTIPENVVFDSKRLIGKQFKDVHIQEGMKHWPFKVIQHKKLPLIELTQNNKSVCYKPEEISALILKYLKVQAESYIKKQVSGCVITVPAHFNYFQRIATREAAKSAGLNIIAIINEPTAAAIAYLHRNKFSSNTKILVFDLGGGTLDVSILKVDNGRATIITTAGNTHLGGRDFDNNLAKVVLKKMVDLGCLNDEIAKRRVYAIAEYLKIQLSENTETAVNLPHLTEGDIIITRQEFEDVNWSLFKSAVDLVVDCLSDAKLTPNDVDEIVLVGGSTKIPKIREMLLNLCNAKPLRTDINPDEVVAYGAAVQSSVRVTSNKAEVIVQDLTPLSLGIKKFGSLMSIIIPRKSPIPITKTKMFYTVGSNISKFVVEIYEGERPLVENNIYIGSCFLTRPSKIPLFKFIVTFCMDGDGILRVSIKDTLGMHKEVPVTYKYHKEDSVSDLLLNAKLNQGADNKTSAVVLKCAELSSYCKKLKVLCEYGKRDMSDEDKIVVLNAVSATRHWLKKNKVPESLDGVSDLTKVSLEENNLRSICSPILAKYDYPELFGIHFTRFNELINSETSS